MHIMQVQVRHQEGYSQVRLKPQVPSLIQTQDLDQVKVSHQFQVSSQASKALVDPKRKKQALVLPQEKRPGVI